MVCLLYTHIPMYKPLFCFSSQLIAHTSHKLPGTATLGHYDRPSVDLCGMEIDRCPPLILHTALTSAYP